jgi:hypothetical protein
MSALSNPATRQLWVRIARVSLALFAMRGARALGELAERLLPADLRREL